MGNDRTGPCLQRTTCGRKKKKKTAENGLDVSPTETERKPSASTS